MLSLLTAYNVTKLWKLEPRHETAEKQNNPSVKRLDKAFIHLKESIRLSEAIGSSVIQEKNKIGYYGISSSALRVYGGSLSPYQSIVRCPRVRQREANQRRSWMCLRTDIASSISIPGTRKDS